MFGGNLIIPVVVNIDYDPAADDVLPVFVAPKKCTIESASATVVNDVAASTANHFAVNLLNGGAAGTATTVISSTLGGTAGWTGLTPKPFTLSDAELAAGDVLVLNYDEEGTGTFANLLLQLNVRIGE